MAFETMITATYVLTCDSCGAKAGDWQESTFKAILEGEKAGYKEAGYIENGVTMQAWLCGSCWRSKRKNDRQEDDGREAIAEGDYRYHRRPGEGGPG